MSSHDRFAEALKLCEAAVAKLKVAVGPDNPNVATALAIKVRCLQATLKCPKPCPESSRLHQRCCKGGRRCMQVGILRSLGRPEEAEQPARKALAIREAAFGTESKEAASAYHCMAETLADLRRQAQPWIACAGLDLQATCGCSSNSTRKGCLGLLQYMLQAHNDDHLQVRGCRGSL